jgi:hypothetical protein
MKPNAAANAPLVHFDWAAIIGLRRAVHDRLAALQCEVSSHCCPGR